MSDEKNSGQRPNPFFMQMTPQERRAVKLSLYSKFLWFAFILFGMVGMFTGHPVGFVVMFSVTSAWVAKHILDDALDAWRITREINEAAEAEKKGDE